MTRVMFTGPHGIGKSASAIKLNKALPDYFYVPSFAGPVAKRMGFDINKPYTFEQLLAYQERVLEVFIESYKATSFMHTIYDRSPNDIAAYFRTGIGYDTVHESYVSSFERKCLQATLTYCDILIYPEADLAEPMQDKYNRPTGAKYGREAFDKLIDSYVCQLNNHQKIKIIDIPAEYQYDNRVNYILEKIK